MGLPVAVAACCRLHGIYRTTPAHWFERANLAATEGIPAQPFNRGVQQSFVAGELLQGSIARAAANNGDQITGLHLFIHKLFQRCARVCRAFKRQPQIIRN